MKNNNTTLGLLTIPLSSILAVLTLWLRGPLNFPLSDKLEWVATISSPNYLLFQNLILVAYVLPLLGFFVLYNVVAENVQVKNIAFLGLIGSVLGTALALPASGIVSFVAPFAAQLDVDGQILMGQAITDAIIGKGMWVGIVAAVMYTVGPLLFGIAIWRHPDLSRVAAVLFIIHGGLLSFGFSFFPLLLVGWGSLAISGILCISDLRKNQTT